MWLSKRRHVRIIRKATIIGKEKTRHGMEGSDKLNIQGKLIELCHISESIEKTGFIYIKCELN